MFLGGTVKKMKEEMVNNNIIKRPKNYYAIYARRSSPNDSNSINAQIDSCKKFLKDKNLLLYAVYEDPSVSAKSISPWERKGFGKLLSDAKSGCFKTIVAYKHDRIVRNYDDWVELKSQLKKLGITIIISEEYTSDGTYEGETLESMIVMFADIEPDNIADRTKHGKEIMRQEGVYSCGKYVTFGYVREKVDIKIKGFKSEFRKEPVKAAFVKYMFKYYDDLIKQGKASVYEIRDDIKSFFSELGDEQVTIEKLNIIMNKCSSILKKDLINEIIYEFNKGKIGGVNDLNTDFKDVLNYLKSAKNTRTILTSPVYACQMLRDAKTKNKGIVKKQGKPMLDIDSFYVGTINVKEIIEDLELLKRVCCYCFVSENMYEDEYEEYLLKNKIFCDICGKKMYMKNGLLRCHDESKTKECKAYSRTNLIRAILEVVISETLNNKLDSGFNGFLSQINSKIGILVKQVNEQKKLKLEILEDYLKYRSPIYNDTIYSMDEDITKLTIKLANFRKQQEHIITLKDLIKGYTNNKINEEQRDTISILETSFISHIITNHNDYNKILDSIIKSIRVKAYGGEDHAKCKIKIEYGFSFSESKEDSHLLESIH